MRRIFLLLLCLAPVGCQTPPASPYSQTPVKSNVSDESESIKSAALTVFNDLKGHYWTDEDPPQQTNVLILRSSPSEAVTRVTYLQQSKRGDTHLYANEWEVALSKQPEGWRIDSYKALTIEGGEFVKDGQQQFGNP